MKKYLFTGLFAILLMAACKKDYTAAFNTSLSAYYLKQQIAFNNTSSGGSSNWNFGDGTTSTVKSPTHAYSQPGSYTVTLTDGSSIATKAITIYHGTAAFQVFNATTTSIPDMFTFTADASGYIVDYIAQGTIGAGSTGTVYYTSDSTIYLGGTLPGTDTMFVVGPPHYPFILTKNVVNQIEISNGIEIGILNSIPATKTKVQDINTKAVTKTIN
jgi:PKD repeat protein